jgi:hypothetical protein
MNQPAIPLEELDQETAATRKLLERVPTEKGKWKPHEKSLCGRGHDRPAAGAHLRQADFELR